MGTRVVGCVTAGKWVNSGTYVILEIGDSLKVMDEHTNKVFECTPVELSKNSLLAHAVTYNRLQGITLQGTLCIHSMTSRYFTREHLYTGISRVVDGQHVVLAKE